VGKRLRGHEIGSAGGLLGYTCLFFRRERGRDGDGDGDGGSAREENGRRVVIGWFAVGREMRKRGGGRGGGGVGWSGGFDGGDERGF